MYGLQRKEEIYILRKSELEKRYEKDPLSITLEEDKIIGAEQRARKESYRWLMVNILVALNIVLILISIVLLLRLIVQR